MRPSSHTQPLWKSGSCAAPVSTAFIRSVSGLSFVFICFLCSFVFVTALHVLSTFYSRVSGFRLIKNRPRGCRFSPRPVCEPHCIRLVCAGAMLHRSAVRGTNKYFITAAPIIRYKTTIYIIIRLANEINTEPTKNDIKTSKAVHRCGTALLVCLFLSRSSRLGFESLYNAVREISVFISLKINK